MKSFATPAHRHPWIGIHFAVTLLMALLQRTPALRVLAIAETRIAAPPFATVLKSTVASAAALGAVHTLAGATVLVASQPSPVTVTAGQPITPIAFTVSNTINLGSWRLGGTLPPGLKLVAAQDQSEELTGPGVLDASGGGGADEDDGYGYGGGETAGDTMTTPLLTGTPTQPGSYTITLQAYQLGGLSGLTTTTFSYTINVAASATGDTAPAFTTQPAPQSATVGSTVVLTAAASGTPAPAYQWHRNGVAISGATGATLTLANVQLSDAGTYTVVATNSSGTATSTAITVAISTPPATGTPGIARHPAAQVIATGSTVVFAADVSGASAYQWHKDGAAIPGATSASLVIRAATAADAGNYSVVATNSSGSATSNAARLELSDNPTFGHLINLSIRTTVTASDPFFTIGTAVGGVPGGTKPLLVRAVGPSLAAFGITTALADAKLDMFSGPTVVASNVNWDGVTALSTTFAQVGAFPFASADSKDAAVFNPNLAAGNYTVQVSGVGGAAGEVLAELYDASPASSFSASVPRLVNVSVRKQIERDELLTAGFVLGGQTSRTVLVRAIGPGLTVFGLTDVMADPQLALFSGASQIAENDNWGGDAQLTSAGGAVGAFAIADAGSRDAMLLITLAPGNYTAQVSGVGGSGGEVLVEIYEVP